MLTTCSTDTAQPKETLWSRCVRTPPTVLYCVFNIDDPYRIISPQRLRSVFNEGGKDSFCHMTSSSQDTLEPKFTAPVRGPTPCRVICRIWYHTRRSLVPIPALGTPLLFHVWRKKNQALWQSRKNWSLRGWTRCLSQSSLCNLLSPRSLNYPRLWCLRLSYDTMLSVCLFVVFACILCHLIPVQLSSTRVILEGTLSVQQKLTWWVENTIDVLVMITLQYRSVSSP